MTWHKSDVRLQCSPRLRRIGSLQGRQAQRDATLLYLALLAVNAEHDCDGKISAIYSDLGYVVTYCPSFDLAELPKVLDQLAEVELVELGIEGIAITGWDETWRAVKTSTARVRLHRHLKKAQSTKNQQRARGSGAA